MKRIAAMILAVLLLAAVFAGCSKAGPEGVYVVKTIGGKSVEQAFEEMLAEYGSGQTLDEYLKELGVASLDEFMTMELKADGTAVASVALEDEPSVGTWKQEGDKLMITLDGDTAEYSFSGNEIRYKVGEQDYVLVKK